MSITTNNPGVLLHQYIIHIKSIDPTLTQITTGYNSNARIALNSSIQTTGPNQELHLTVSTAELPISWYAFSSDLNNLNIYVDGAASLALTAGNYDVYELAIAINASVAFPYTATYNQNTNKYTLTNDDSTQHIINFSNTTNGQLLGKAMGFTNTDITVAAGGNCVSDGMANFQTIGNVYVYSDLATANVITTTTGNFEGVIEKIPVEAPPLGRINFAPTQTANFSVIVSNKEIRNFSIALRDQQGNLIQLNGCKWDLSLLIEIWDYSGPTQQISSGSNESGFSTMGSSGVMLPPLVGLVQPKSDFQKNLEANLGDNRPQVAASEIVDNVVPEYNQKTPSLISPLVIPQINQSPVDNIAKDNNELEQALSMASLISIK